MSVLEVYVNLYINNIYTLSLTHTDGAESGVVRCQCLERRQHARGTCTKPSGRQPANSWLSQPDPSQGMARRSGRVTSRVKERIGFRKSELASERANWRPREQVGVRESKLASERANWRPREQIGVRESGWALG